jgi:hypothetical protein
MLTGRLIRLNYTRAGLEGVYDLSENGRLHRNKQIRPYFVFFLITSILLVISAMFSVIGNLFIVFTAMLLLIWIGSVIALLWLYLPIVRWRKDVMSSIHDILKYKDSSLEVTSNGFTLYQDDKETFVMWNSLISFQLESNYVFLSSKENFVFPRDSMSGEDFEFLKNYLSTNVKNGL